MANNVTIEKVVTSGTFSLDGETFDVDNNVWIVGDDAQVVVIDAAHDADAIIAAVGDRKVVALVLTHAHDDHIDAAGALQQGTGAPAWLHPDDRMLWDVLYSEGPQHDLSEGTVVSVGGVDLSALHTPGHSPGSTCLYAPALGVLFSGDTLFDGGPGATGRSYSDRPTIEASIRERLFILPPDTVVHTGHGTDTTIEAEAARTW
ncbi:MAG: MBL fold metallo-hydrolase [Nocardioidaceae bacterium]|jgi:glyoxylase-like metal-dependent hydrolase (beta-lactamase superfamily II)|nr:MBL fold metallo-hydrolase [Nocardioidaceae bacterium]